MEYEERLDIFDAIRSKEALERKKELKYIHDEAHKRWNRVKTGKETWDEFVKIYGEIKEEVEEYYKNKE